MKDVPRLDPRETTAQIAAFGDAFRKEAFDARGLHSAGETNAHVAAWGAAHLAHFVEAAILVLDVDQRTALAQRLREHTTNGPMAQGPQ
jgi:hypothetical protein